MAECSWEVGLLLLWNRTMTVLNVWFQAIYIYVFYSLNHNNKTAHVYCLTKKKTLIFSYGWTQNITTVFFLWVNRAVYVRFMSRLQWTIESYFISSCQRSTMTSRPRLERSHADLEHFGSLVPLISRLSLSDKLSSHKIILQRRHDLSGLEWLSSADCGQGDEAWEHLLACLVDLQIGDINLFIFRVCQLRGTAAATTVKQRTGKQIPLQEGKHMT